MPEESHLQLSRTSPCGHRRLYRPRFQEAEQCVSSLEKYTATSTHLMRKLRKPQYLKIAHCLKYTVSGGVIIVSDLHAVPDVSRCSSVSPVHVLRSQLHPISNSMFGVSPRITKYVTTRPVRSLRQSATHRLPVYAGPAQPTMCGCAGASGTRSAKLYLLGDDSPSRL